MVAPLPRPTLAQHRHLAPRSPALVDRPDAGRGGAGPLMGREPVGARAEARPHRRVSADRSQAGPGSKVRLVTIAPHPIQYHAPLFRALAGRLELDFEVAFLEILDD